MSYSSDYQAERAKIENLSLEELTRRFNLIQWGYMAKPQRNLEIAIDFFINKKKLVELAKKHTLSTTNVRRITEQMYRRLRDPTDG